LVQEKLAALLQTRLFDKLEEEVGKLKQVHFPDLQNQIAKAKESTLNEMSTDEGVFDFLKRLLEKYEDL